MHVTTPSITRIAGAYQVSRQALYHILRKHGLSVQELADPARVFEKLLESGNASKLRDTLANPATRENIKNSLK